MDKKLARKAAKWWADQLRGEAPLDNGDDSFTGVMTAMMASILQANEKQSQSAEAIDRFEEKLANEIAKHDDIWFMLGVDYNPDYTLQSAADAAGLSLGMTTLPWKTRMWINSGKVTVACGYGAETVEI